MKKITFLVGLFLASCMTAFAQVPSKAPDVMLQGFYWDSYTDKGYGRTKWTDIQSQVTDISESFDLVWLPPSAKSSGGTGYLPKEWCNQNSDWGGASDLKKLIAAFKENGTRCVADIVINHRIGNYNWTDFCDENFGTYGSFKLYDASTGDSRSLICKDDECVANGYVATGNNDSGYGYDPTCDGVSAKGAYCAARDLDHSNTTVQNAIKAYLKWMKGEMGFDGWRYDLVKGYWGGYTKIYNNAAAAYMSVGEYWDGNYDAVKTWISDTEGTSMAFDFPNKYAALNEALKQGNYEGMGGGYKAPPGLCGSTETVKGKLMKAYAVTFVDNHDTFRDGSNFSTDGTMIVKANAYILSIPGIPCVFYPHWKNHKADIKKMIAARKAVGIHSESPCTTEGSCGSYYKGTTTGSNGTLICFIGGGWTAPSGYTLACSGNGWAYYTNVTVPSGPTVTMSPTGGYVGANGKVTLTASKGTIYYTTNGTTPSASSTKYTGPITITTNNTTIKAIAIDGSNKSSVVSGTFLTEKPAGLTVEFKAPAGWGSVNLYAWDANETAVLGEWPGKAITKNGDYYTYTITETDARPLNIIFNDGTNQTADITSVSADACYDGTNPSGKDAKGYIIPGSCGSSPTPDPEPDPDPTPGPTPDPTPGPTGEGYYICVNGSAYYEATKQGSTDHQGREQYMASVSLKAGDKFKCYNGSTGDSWSIVALEPYGLYTNFTAATVYSDDVVCKVAGCYDIYIKLKYEDDTMYIGEGTNCSEPTPDPDPTPGPTPIGDYYLIGYINGADYGSGETDWENLGDYKFVNGKVTATFSVESYVYIKTGDLSKWYMAETYVLPSTSGATGNLYLTTSPSAPAEKIGVPAGTVTFTLKENADGSLTLSYTLGGTSTAIEENNATSVTIYPNPTTGKASIVADQDVNYVVIRNLIGKTVASFSSNLLDLSNLAASMYLVEIQFANGESTVQKLIKK